MRYTVPPDMSEKEKIIGGVLTLVQLFWLALFGFMGVGFFLITQPLFGVIFSGILLVPFLVAGGFFAFYKKENLSFYKYLLLKQKHKRKNKKITNFRKEVNLKW